MSFSNKIYHYVPQFFRNIMHILIKIISKRIYALFLKTNYIYMQYNNNLIAIAFAFNDSLFELASYGVSHSIEVMR